MRVWKSLTQVNSTDAGNQFEEQITGLRDGGYVVVWEDDSRTYNPSGNAIVGQRYDAFGNKVGGEVSPQLNRFITRDQDSPAITTLSNGNIAVAFEDVRDKDYDIYVRIFDPSLNLLRVDPIDTDDSLNTTLPSITALADGGYAVSYTLYTGHVIDTHVIVRSVSPTGAVGVPYDIGSGENQHSQVATLSNGNFVVVYENSGTFNQSLTDIQFFLFTPYGGKGGVVHEGSFLQFPDVATLRDGGFAVVWAEDSGGASGSDIILSTRYSDGTLANNGILVNTTTAGDRDHPNIVALADGSLLVTWEDLSDDSIKAQRFDYQADYQIHKVGSEFTVKAGLGVTGSPSDEAAALLADGRVAYALGDYSSGDLDVTTSIWSTRAADDDFNGDVKSDIVMHNDAGQSLIWSMNGAAINGGAFLPDIGPGWQLAAAADFNGDSKSDILWHQDSGLSLLWAMDGTGVTGGGFLPDVGPGWHVGAAADFNGDSKADILWHQDNGLSLIWTMDATTVTGGGFLPNIGPGWQAAAAADFDGDSKPDILWHQDNGLSLIWTMDGTTVTGGAFLPNVGPGWHVGAAADFNGDGKSDILWHQDNGLSLIWTMNGTTVTGGAFLPNIGAGWHVAAAADFNVDGKSDILWHHDSGLSLIWTMDGTTVTGGAFLPNVGSDWHLL